MITVTWGSYKMILGRVGFGRRVGNTEAFSPDPLWRYWWEYKLGLVSFGRDWLVNVGDDSPSEEGE